MHRAFIPLTGIALATAAWAQDASSPADTSAAAIAERAMKAMDALDTPGEKAKEEKGGKPERSEKSDKSGKKPAGEKPGIEKPESDDEAGDAPAPPLLPAPPADARGVDLMSRARMDMMIPTGRSHKGVHYPTYLPVEPDRAVLDPVLGGVAGVTAPMASLFESDLVTRLDNDHVQFDRAKWVQFDEKPAPDGKAKPTMTLEIERGVYDLKNEILMTNQPVKIENQQFLITGDTMLHDRASGLTRLTGRVRMTFYNEEPEPAAAAPAPPETPRQP